MELSDQMKLKNRSYQDILDLSQIIQQGFQNIEDQKKKDDEDFIRCQEYVSSERKIDKFNSNI
jgi:hypothetical protein